MGVVLYRNLYVYCKFKFDRYFCCFFVYVFFFDNCSDVRVDFQLFVLLVKWFFECVFFIYFNINFNGYQYL